MWLPDRSKPTHKIFHIISFRYGFIRSNNDLADIIQINSVICDVLNKTQKSMFCNLFFFRQIFDTDDTIWESALDSLDSGLGSLFVHLDIPFFDMI